MRDSLRLRLKWILLALFLIALVAAALSMEQYLQRMMELPAQGGTFMWLAFIILATIGLCIGLPGTAVIIIAGVIFSFWHAYWVVLLSTTLSATIMFYIGRYFSELLHIFEKGYIRRLMRFLQRHAESHGFYIVLIMRLAFIHYAALSYAAGLIRTMRFWPFFGATLVTNLVYNFIFVFVGVSLSKSLPYVLGALGLALCVVFTSLYVKRRRRLPD